MAMGALRSPFLPTRQAPRGGHQHALPRRRPASRWPRPERNRSVAQIGLCESKVEFVAVFYFYIFQFYFLQKYIFVFEIYRNIARPPRCRAARSRPPSSGAAGVYSCKFRKQKYIFVKNENKKYKNKKPLFGVSCVRIWAWVVSGLVWVASWTGPCQGQGQDLNSI